MISRSTQPVAYPIRVAQFGLGPIGVESIRLAAQRDLFEVVGAVDIDPAKTGRTLRELTGDHRFGTQRVYGSFGPLLAETAPHLVLHTAGSDAAEAIDQIRPMAEAGVSVVSSCEMLIFPWLRAAEAAEELDRIARGHDARVVATGVNPGFVMDLLPVLLTAVSRSVQRICVRRVVDASTRRQPLQKKIGSGLDPAEFRQRFRHGRAGHAGLQESACLVVHCMGWRLDELAETCEPVVAERPIRTAHFEVPAGATCGLHQRCVGRESGRVRVELDLTMALDAPEPHDALTIDGDPPLQVLVQGGVAGDAATVGALVNTAPRLLLAPPGLRLLTDLAAPCWGEPTDQAPAPPLLGGSRRSPDVTGT